MGYNQFPNKASSLHRVETAIGSNVLIRNHKGGLDEAYIIRVSIEDLKHHMTKLERLVYNISK